MNTELIKLMHTKFGISSESVAFSQNEKVFRIAAMQEELDEYAAANSKADELDALVDLVVFALGTAERQGVLPFFNEAFERVMRANMTKTLGPNNKRGGFAIDLVKPAGFKSPDLSDLTGDNHE